MSDVPWQARLSPKALDAVSELPAHAREMLRDVLDIASRDPWAFKAFDRSDPDGEDIRSAGVGHLSVIYFVNRAAGRVYVIDLVWLG